MNRKLFAGLVALSLWGAAAMPASAADPLLNELYGQGVHAYNASKYADAHELLTEAIDSGSRDPRAFYFRGLVYAKTGRPELAEADYKQASALELSNDVEVFNVSRALERVQGRDRMDIERHRRAAKLAVVRETAKADKARYEEGVAREERVIRRPAGGGSVAGPAVKPMPGATSPFDEGVGVGKTEVAPEKTTKVEEPAAGAADPFGEKPAAPMKPAAGDPFGEAPAATKPVPKPPVAAEDPFGEAPAPAPKPADPAPAPKPAPAEDPFGEAPAPAPKPVDPAPTPKPAPADDPFGEAPAPAPKPVDPAPAPKPAPADDPFGEAPAPAPKPADPAPAPKPADPAPAPKPAPADDPFAEDPAPAPKPADSVPAPAPKPADDPFGAAPAPKAADAPAVAGKRSLFGKLLDATARAMPGEASGVSVDSVKETIEAVTPKSPPAEDPFGAPPAVKAPPAPAPADDPFGAPAPAPKAPPAPAEDPFGAAPAPAPKAPAAPDPAEDPFAPPADPKPAPKPAPADDPFGS